MNMMGSILGMGSFHKGNLRKTFISAGLSPQSIDTDDETSIHFWAPTHPTPKPPLVLLHGLGPSAFWQWHHQIPFFAPHFALYIPDLLFFDESITSSSDISEIFQAKTVAKMLETLGVQKYHVMGTDYGGFVAYQMAQLFPDKVERVIIASCALNWTKGDCQDLLMVAKADKLEDIMMPKTAKQFKTVTALYMVKNPNVDFALGDIVKTFSENREEKAELLRHLTFGQDDTVKCSALRQDTLLIWGQYDQIFRLEKAFELQKILGEKVKLEVIKNTAHLPHVEDPNQFNKIVMKFFCSSF